LSSRLSEKVVRQYYSAVGRRWVQFSIAWVDKFGDPAKYIGGNIYDGLKKRLKHN